MFSNFLKIAVRNIFKQKGFSFINISGFALGLACAILILLWVQDELSYNKFHTNVENLYRVEEDQHYSGEIFHVNVTPFPSAPVWQDEIPEITAASRYSWGMGMLVRYQDKAFFENEVRAVDPSFLEMFSFPLIQGQIETALNDPLSIIISTDFAEKYFADENPIGKVLRLNNEYDVTVTGVMANRPNNSSLEFDALMPFEFTKTRGWYNDCWGCNSIQTFVQLQGEIPLAPIDKKLTDIVRIHNEDSDTDYMLKPFADMHLHSYFGYGKKAGNIQYVYIFSVVALFVLLLACVNFMNLSTARSANRAKEIGLRKVSGARRGSIAVQFLGESVIISFASLCLAVLLVALVMPVFNILAGKEMSLDILFTAKMGLGLFLITSFSGLIAGSYPAFFLSAFKPVSVLKSSIKSGAKSSTLRKVLVVMQFALSIFLIIGTSVVFRQLQFMKNKDLGYDKEQLLYINLRGESNDSYKALKNELLQRSEILGVTGTTRPPGRIGSNSSGAKWQGSDPEQEILISQNYVGYDFTETMGIEMAQGRSFSQEFPSDVGTDSTGAFLINEELAKIMGLEPVVGAHLSFMGKEGTIVGVTKNFHFNSVRVDIEPLVMAMKPSDELGYAAIRIKPGDISASIDVIRDVWSQVIPNYPFEFKFLDEELDKMYRAEERMSGLLKYFTILAILISCLGLFGLASFMTEQRTREIGVRKVLGASVGNVILLLSKEFTAWVAISCFIACPVAWFVMNNWLQQFAFRIELGWLVFLVAGFLALIIALLTVSSQAIKSAVMNPAKALRYE